MLATYAETRNRLSVASCFYNFLLAFVRQLADKIGIRTTAHLAILAVLKTSPPPFSHIIHIFISLAWLIHATYPYRIGNVGSMVIYFSLFLILQVCTCISPLVFCNRWISYRYFLSTLRTSFRNIE